MSRARRVTRARGSLLSLAAQASAVRSSAMTVTRSPLPTDSAVRLARTPKAVTLTQRVMLSPEPLPRGTSMARRSLGQSRHVLARNRAAKIRSTGSAASRRATNPSACAAARAPCAWPRAGSRAGP